MSRCAFCGQSYTGLKAEHFKTCRVIGYALGDVDYCDLPSARMSEHSKKNARVAKNRRQHRGRIQVFGKQSLNFKP